MVHGVGQARYYSRTGTSKRRQVKLHWFRSHDNGNKNVTNLHIWQWKTIDFHALHVHFSFLDIPPTFSFFLRREMTCFAVISELFKVITVAKCVLTIQELNWNQRFRDKKIKLNIPSSCAHVVLTTAKQVISRRRKNENVCGMSKNEKCTCKAWKSIVFHCQICKFVTFLLPLSPWLRKLPTMRSQRTITKNKTLRLRVQFFLLGVRVRSSPEGSSELW